MAPKIYDWPASLAPKDQLFYVPGMAVEGGFTTSSAAVLLPAAGGRAVLEFSFGTHRRGQAPEAYSWAVSKIFNGSVFRIPIWSSRQMISGKDLGLSASDCGVMWDNGQPWANGEGWRFEPVVTARTKALEGSTSLTLDFGTFARNLRVGHLIGYQDKDGRDSAYVIDDIEWNGRLASVTVTPPLRAEIARDDVITLRPRMLATCANPESFKSALQLRKWATPGSVTFVEALL